MSIKVKEVVKQFDGFTALGGVSLQINSGELVALLGPSGSGKTTLLRIIAGLDFPTGGKIKMDGIDASTKHVGARNVGFVFQHYALFRHMTVFENVAFGLRVKPRRIRPQEAEIRERVMRLLKLVQLEGFAQRYPSQLSGGQRQRVALARALAIEPRVLLLDEPFGALDAKVRKELRRWLRRLHEEMGLTSVFVTHDQEEALELADRVVVMSNGKIEQVGTPDEVYERPATPFVYEFLGHVNRMPCTVARGRARIWHQEFGVEIGRIGAGRAAGPRPGLHPARGHRHRAARAGRGGDAGQGAARQHAGPDRPGRAAGSGYQRPDRGRAAARAASRAGAAPRAGGPGPGARRQGVHRRGVTAAG